MTGLDRPVPSGTPNPRRGTVCVHGHALVPTLLLGLLAACAWSSPGRGAAAAGRAGVSAGAVSASAAGGSRSGAVSLVSCSGNSCSVTLSGSGSLVHVLGTTFGVADVEGNRATLRVDGRDVTCPVGQGVSVGALRLTCTATTDHAVTFTVVRD
jgi:hypothetical protein